MIFTDSKPIADFYTSDVFIKKDKIAVFIDKEKEFVYKVFPKSKTLKFFK